MHGVYEVLYVLTIIDRVAKCSILITCTASSSGSMLPFKPTEHSNWKQHTQSEDQNDAKHTKNDSAFDVWPFHFFSWRWIFYTGVCQNKFFLSFKKEIYKIIQSHFY